MGSLMFASLRNGGAANTAVQFFMPGGLIVFLLSCLMCEVTGLAASS
jgi:hypothetical protein